MEEKLLATIGTADLDSQIMGFQGCETTIL